MREKDREKRSKRRRQKEAERYIERGGGESESDRKTD